MSRSFVVKRLPLAELLLLLWLRRLYLLLQKMVLDLLDHGLVVRLDLLHVLVECLLDELRLLLTLLLAGHVVSLLCRFIFQGVLVPDLCLAPRLSFS